MRRTTLNKQDTPKALRLALFLVTLLLLPSTAWGQTTYQSSKYNNETPTKWGDWNISSVNVISILGSETLQTGIENGILFVVEASKIGTATITLNRPDNPKGIGLISLEVGPKNGDFATVLSSAKIGDNDIKGLFVSSNLDNGNTLYTYEPATLTEWPEGNNIVVSFTYNNTKNDNESRLLKEAKVVTGSPYGLTVAGVEVTSANKNDVLNNGGKVKFTPASGGEPATLQLDEANITGDIEWNNSERLNIKILKSNTITGRIYSSTSPLLHFTFDSGSKDAILEINNSANSAESAISGFEQVSMDEDLDYDEKVSYQSQALKDGDNNASLVHISYHYGLNLYKGNTLQMSFSAYNPSFSHESAGIGEFTSGTMSFDPTSNTLTLTGVTIADGIILWDHIGDSETLKIALSGNSTITCETPMTITQESGPQVTTQIKAPIISRAEVNYWTVYPTPSERANQPYIQFTSADQNERSLILSKKDVDNCIQGFKYIDNSVVDGSVTHTKTTDNIDGGHAYMLITSESYMSLNNILVHGIEGFPTGYKANVTGETNQKNEPLISYDSEENTLTLNGVNLTTTSDFIFSNLSDLKINLVGDNTISVANGYVAFKGNKTNAKTTFNTSTTNPGNLAITVPEANLFSSITDSYQEGLSHTYKDGVYTISATSYGLTVAGVEVTSLNCEDILDGENKGKVSFTPATISLDSQTPSTPATLTLNGAKITGTVFWTNSAPLTIAINGTNSITTTGAYAIEGNNQDNTTLTIAKVSETGKCKLILSGSTGGSISGFKNSSDTYAGSGLVYYEDQAERTATILSTLSGSGTSTDPYLIETPEDLKDFSFFVNKQIITNKYIKIANNIDCKDLEGFESIGSSYPFMGTLSGYGNTISNLTINSGLGFFGHISGGIVNDLNFYKLSVKGNSYATGGIASELSAGGQIDNCTLTECTIACLDNQYSPEVGGIVARLSDSGSKISNCVVYNSTINASTTYTGGSGPIGYAGGIVASYSSGTITNCHVKDGSKIINVNADGGSTLKTGALVGNMSSETTTSITSNFYYYDVTVETQLGSSDKETKSGYTPRGTNDNTEDPTGAMLYTKDVIIPISTDAGHVSISSDYYYKVSSDNTTNTTYSIAPDVEVVISVENADVEGSYTLENETKTIELNPKEGSTGLYTFDMPNADVTFTVQEAAAVHFSEEGQIYVTYYNATKDVAVPMGMTAYIVTGVSEDGTKVIVSPVSYIKKGVAVLIEKDKTTEVSETTDFSSNKLIYAENDVPVTTESKLYVLYQNQFVKVTSGTQIPTGKNYLDLSTFTNAGTRGFYDIGGANDGTSALRGVVAEGTNGKSDAWFTLQGRRLSAKPTKSGLYLHNGKKVVIK